MPSGGQLYFCGHHANEHLPSLVGGGAQSLDARHFMNDGERATRRGGPPGLQARGGTDGVPARVFILEPPLLHPAGQRAHE